MKFLCLLLFAPSLAFGACSVPITWTNPTTNVNGSPLTDLVSVNVYRASSAAGLVVSGCTGSCTPNTAAKIASTPSTPQAFTDTTCTDGTTYFYALTAVSTSGGESLTTNPVTVTTLPPPKPNPPTAVTVGTMTAFDIVKTPGKLQLLAIGTVPAGTACDTSQSVNGLYAVPTAAITYIGSVRPPVAWAACG